MIRTIALWTNWAVLALFSVAMFATSRLHAFGPESLFPILPFATALANYHFQPQLAMVWLAMALNVLFCVIAIAAIIAVSLGKTDQPVIAALAITLLIALPCAFNVRNMLRIRLRLKQDQHRSPADEASPR